MTKGPLKLNELQQIEDPKALLEALEDLVSQLQMWLASGSSVQLEGLDGHVARLCKGIMGLPEETGKLLAPRLESLAQQLGNVGTAMQLERTHIQDELAQMQQVRKAHQAYGKASHPKKGE